MTCPPTTSPRKHLVTAPGVPSLSLVREIDRSIEAIAQDEETRQGVRGREFLDPF